MGRDIHWVIERRHPTEGWQAVAAKTELSHAAMRSPSWPHDVDFSTIERQIGQRDYDVFHLLSGAQFEDDEDGDQLATPWLPKDASSYAIADLDDGGDIHSQGYALVAHMEDAVVREDHPAIRALTEAQADHADRLSIQEIQSLLSARAGAILQTARNPKVSGAILNPRDETGAEILPSAHRRLELVRIFDELEPVHETSVRILIGYDN